MEKLNLYSALYDYDEEKINRYAKEHCYKAKPERKAKQKYIPNKVEER